MLYKICSVNFISREGFEGLRIKWEYNIKIHLTDIVWVDVHLIQVSQDSVQWREPQWLTFWFHRIRACPHRMNPCRLSTKNL